MSINKNNTIFIHISQNLRFVNVIEVVDFMKPQKITLVNIKTSFDGPSLNASASHFRGIEKFSSSREIK